jgi:hypothetical protein
MSWNDEKDEKQRDMLSALAKSNEALMELGKSFADYAPEPSSDTPDQAKRREAWRQANASVRLSDGKISPKFLAVQESHITGEISNDDLDRWIEGLLFSRKTL